VSELLSLEELCQWLRISRSTAYGLTRSRQRIRNGTTIPFLKLGKRLIFRRESVEQWLQLQESKLSIEAS